MSTTNVDLEALSRRPQRADAARNYDKLIAAARTVFTEREADASLEEIARRAGVGIGTLYRNFPNRQALLEAVYAEEVVKICEATTTVGDLEPWDALVTWLQTYTGFAATKRALMDELSTSLSPDDPTPSMCRAAIFDSAGPLLTAAQASGDVREDVGLVDVVRMISSIATAPGAPEDQVERMLTIAIDGLRAR